MSNLPLIPYTSINHYYNSMLEDYIDENKVSLNNIIKLIKEDPEFILLRNYLTANHENIACAYLLKEDKIDETDDLTHNVEFDSTILYNENKKETLEPLASIFFYIGITAILLSRCFNRDLTDSLIVVRGTHNEILMNMTVLDFIHRLEKH